MHLSNPRIRAISKIEMDNRFPHRGGVKEKCPYCSDSGTHEFFAQDGSLSCLRNKKMRESVARRYVPATLIKISCEKGEMSLAVGVPNSLKLDDLFL